MNADGDFCHVVPSWFKTSLSRVKYFLEQLPAFPKPENERNFLPFYKDAGLKKARGLTAN